MLWYVIKHVGTIKTDHHLWGDQWSDSFSLAITITIYDYFSYNQLFSIISFSEKKIRLGKSLCTFAKSSACLRFFVNLF